MLDLNYVREHLDEVTQGLRKRGAEAYLASFGALDARRRTLLVEVEELNRARNEKSRRIGGLIKDGQDAEPLKQEVRGIGDKIAALKGELESTESELTSLMHQLTNLPHESVPVGETEAQNRIEREWGEKPEFGFEPKAHWDLGVELGILDFERATKITGARFAIYFGDGAKLERALIQFMLEMHTTEHGYTEVLPPFMVNEKSLFGTTQLPKFEEDLFKVEPGGYYLVPTAEVPVTNIHADEILDLDRLPIAYCAYTPCFRSEAGSYGQDVRGLIRQHQFNKVKLVRFAKPEDSWNQLELLTSHAEEVLKRLEIPYRVVTLCTGDLGFGSAKTYDLEVWLPAQGVHREISSCSNFRPEPKSKTRLVHTLNGSALAVGRTLVAILENGQQPVGSVVIPEALRPFMCGQERIERRG